MSREVFVVEIRVPSGDATWHTFMSGDRPLVGYPDDLQAIIGYDSNYRIVRYIPEPEV